MKIRWTKSALCVVAGFAACSTASSQSSTFHLQTPNPLTVTPVLDPANAAVAVVNATAGGSIQATGSDGTTYTLAVPANALIFDTEITLTPVASIGGLPFSGGLQAAVQIAPDGLELYKTAALTITPAKAVPANQQIGFGYHGSGSEFHLEALTTTALVFDIEHFSGYGGGLGTGADVSQQELRPPTALLDQLVQYVAQPFFLERPAVIEKDPPLQTPPAVLSSLNSTYQNDILPTANASIASGLPDDVLNVLLQDVLPFALECTVLEDTALAPTVEAEALTLANDYATQATADVQQGCSSLTPSELQGYQFNAFVLTNLFFSSADVTNFLSAVAKCEACPSGCTTGTQTTCCEKGCVDLMSDPNNCGACSNACGGQQPNCCYGVCRNTNSDPTNCGTCGHGCDAGEVCMGGMCQMTSSGGGAVCVGGSGVVLPAGAPPGLGSPPIGTVTATINGTTSTFLVCPGAGRCQASSSNVLVTGAGPGGAGGVVSVTIGVYEPSAGGTFPANNTTGESNTINAVATDGSGDATYCTDIPGGAGSINLNTFATSMGGNVSGTFSGTVVECMPMGGSTITLASGSFSCMANE
jgi:hypothetical protein